MRLYNHVLLTSVLLGICQTSFAAYTVFIDDRTGFNTALTANTSSTIVDTEILGTNSFATDPPQHDNTTQVGRIGTISGNTYGYTIDDVDFSNTPEPLGGSMLTDVISTSTIQIEEGTLGTPSQNAPVDQDGASGSGSWGVDSISGSTSSRNAALFYFGTTPGANGLGHFGVDLHDFEADPTFTSADLRLYDGEVLVHSIPFTWPSDNGDGESHFLGIVTDTPSEFFDQVMIVLGDDSGGLGRTERWAADRFTFGQAYQFVAPKSIPTLSTWGIILLSTLLVLGTSFRRKTR